MTFRILRLLLEMAALGAFLCAAYFYFRSPSEVQGLIIEAPNCSGVGGVVCGREYEIEFRFHNHRGQTARLIGGGGCVS